MSRTSEKLSKHQLPTSICLHSMKARFWAYGVEPHVSYVQERLVGTPMPRRQTDATCTSTKTASEYSDAREYS